MPAEKEHGGQRERAGRLYLLALKCFGDNNRLLYGAQRASGPGGVLNNADEPTCARQLNQLYLQ